MDSSLAAAAKPDEIARGFLEGERIAKLSTFTLLGIGLMEVVIGHLSDSVGLTADGIDSLADATISLVVWQGLRLSRKAPDERFHFGYLKVESFAALVASLGMIAVASMLLYYSYLKFLEPRELSYPAVALLTLLGAGGISLYRALQMRVIAKKYSLLSLRTDAHNSIKDASASFVVFAAVLTSTLGFTQMDAVGGMIVSGYIYSVAYVSIKEASLVLLDACHRPELVDQVKTIVEGTYAVKVEQVRMRRAGPYIVGIVSVAADGTLSLNQVGELKRKIKRELRSQIKGIGRLSVVVHPQRRSDETKQS
jgi:cation diffusion facilitator family transporter